MPDLSQSHGLAHTNTGKEDFAAVDAADKWQALGSWPPLLPLQAVAQDILDILACVNLATRCVDTPLLLVDVSAKEPHHIVGQCTLCQQISRCGQVLHLPVGLHDRHLSDCPCQKSQAQVANQGTQEAASQKGAGRPR